ncbi:MAG: type II CAAX prenyl endopeptidase Rce1 family protein [Patescibacteria group bacterium]
METTYLKTLYKTVLFTTIVLSISYILLYFKIDFFLPKSGNEKIVNLITEGNYLMVFITMITYGLVVVAVEELLFRLIPYKLWKKKLAQIDYWLFGTLIAVVFSLMHSLGTPGINLGFPQLALGIFLWRFIRENNGYKKCVLAHFTYNFLTIVAASIISYLFL